MCGAMCHCVTDTNPLYQAFVVKVTLKLTVCFILPGDDGIAEIYINLLFSLSNVNVPSGDKSDPTGTGSLVQLK